MSIQDLLALPDPERRLGACVLVRQLGRGGYAPVWLAKEVYGTTELRTVAVKLFALRGGRGDRPGSSGARAETVLEEARALCRVEHPHVVRFHALLVDDARGVVGLVMEHVAGSSVEKKLEAGPLPLDETLAVGVAVASALAAVHRAGLVHRDVKPANVVEAGGVYKLIDFGIAAADNTASVVDDLPLDAATDAGISGTVGYIDPVVAATGAAATPASDLYALGALLFECVSGKLPAVAESGGGLDEGVLLGNKPAPRLGEPAPEGLARLVETLLSPAREGRPGSAEAVALELERIRAATAGRSRELPPEDVGPFRGLGRFDAADRDVYFGRTAEIASALELLRGRGLVALVGASGSGKSSLARAGILPAIERGALGAWPPAWDAAIASPGVDPRAAIGAALDALVPGAASRAPEAVVAALAERAQREGRGVVLLVDQLEELVTTSSGASRRWTEQLLARAGQHALPGMRVVVTARRDLLDPLLALPELGTTLVRGSLLVAPLGDAAWVDVLDQALGAYGYALEDDALRAELLKSLSGTAEAMPLVAFALARLWDERDRDRRLITHEGLRRVHGIAGALERHAEAAVTALVTERPDALEGVREALLALTTPQGTRATVDAAKLAQGTTDADRAARALAALEEARLVVREGGSVTLAHEALLTQWARLRRWVAEAREDRLLAAELERDAERWDAEADDTLLWKKRRLGAAEQLLERRVAVGVVARDFVVAARRAERRVRRVMGAVVAIAALGSVALGVVAGGQLERRDRTRDAAGSAARVEPALVAEEQALRALVARLDAAEEELGRRTFPFDLVRDDGPLEPRPNLRPISPRVALGLPPAAAPAIVDFLAASGAFERTAAIARATLAEAREPLVQAWSFHDYVTHTVVLGPHTTGLVAGTIAPVQNPFPAGAPWPMEFTIVETDGSGTRSATPVTRWIGQELPASYGYKTLLTLPLEPRTIEPFVTDVLVERCRRALAAARESLQPGAGHGLVDAIATLRVELRAAR